MIIKVNGVNLFYERSGSGEPIILLHGSGETHEIFDVLAPLLAKNRTVYALDSRNHGESEVTEDYSYETMARDLLAFIAELGIAPADVVGFSDGAITAMTAAMKGGAAIRRMALLGVNLSPEDFLPENLEFIRATLAETGDPLFRMMLEQPNIALADVRKVTAPTLIVAAEDDLFRPEMFRELAEAMPGAELLVMRGHDHDSYITHSDALYKDLARFFGK